MLVVDDLVGWLVERLADAGYKKLTTRLRGTDQERALRGAVTAAVQAAADEISPADKKQSGLIAREISAAFGKPAPYTVLPRKLTRLEGLYAGIAQQLSVLDQGGKLSPSMLGVPVSAVAALLGDHLIGEIINRGAEDGPLTPLANQLNHDLTHLQQEQLRKMLAQVLAEVRDAVTARGSIARSVGRPLTEARDPFLLEVHHPVEPDIPQPGLPALPAYVKRDHDNALAGVVAAAAAGISGIAVLVGGSSTGKTRACWQALELLRGIQPEWRLWHPAGPQSALDGLPVIAPRTVVWLNEAQRHLSSADGAGEQVAAGLRELRNDPGRSPVLVLATLWPELWIEVTVRPSDGTDPHAQARELLSVGEVIWLPEAFTDEQVQGLARAGDPRLAQAAAESRDGQVIQYLAGAPELLARYRQAPPAARALIHAAMDARRLGMRPALPGAFLEAAAFGYMTDTEWDQLQDDWFEQTLNYTAKPCKGTRGPLTSIRPRPSPDVPSGPADGPRWQLADYLDQYGRRTRREEIPPASFWDAAASRADPGDLTAVAEAARDRGLLRDAARLYKRASTHANPMAAVSLVGLLHSLHPDDTRPGNWAATHVSLDNPFVVDSLLGALDQPATTMLLARDPVAGVSLEDPVGVGRLLLKLWRAGARVQVAALLDRDPAAHVSLDSGYGVAYLLDILRELHATEQVSVLATRAAADVSVDDGVGVAHILEALERAQATEQLQSLATRAAAHASLDNPAGVNRLLLALTEARAHGQLQTLATRATAHLDLDNLDAVLPLLSALQQAGAAYPLTSSAVAHTSVHNPAGAARLLKRLTWGDEFDTLASRAASNISILNPDAVAEFLEALHEMGARGHAYITLLRRDPAVHVSLDNPAGVARLLSALQMVRDNARYSRPGEFMALRLNAQELEEACVQSIAMLVDRDPAAHVSLDDPAGVTELLITLRWVRASSQVTKLMDRDPAAHASLDDGHGAAALLTELRNAGAQAQSSVLTERLPAAGRFTQFLEQEGRGGKFRFGREPDGKPAKRWTWTDLDGTASTL